MIKALDGLLEVKEGNAVSALQGIKANPAKPSATAMQCLADKVATIEATGIMAVDLSWLNANYQRALFHYVRKCSADRLRETGRDRRLAALVCFLRQSYCDTVDQAVDMFDKLLTRAHTRAEHELDDQMRGQRQTIRAALAALRSGNLSVKLGKRFGRFEDYFLPKERWEPLRQSFFRRSGLPVDPKNGCEHLTKRLNTAYDLFLRTAPAVLIRRRERPGAGSRRPAWPAQ